MELTDKQKNTHREKLHLINWTFHINEVATNIFCCNGKHVSGNSIQLTGMDPDNLTSKIKAYAEQIEAEIENKKRNCPT